MLKRSKEMTELEKKVEANGGQIGRWVFKIDEAKKYVIDMMIVGHLQSPPDGYIEESGIMAM